MAYKPSLDEQDALLDLVASLGYRALLRRMNAMADLMESRVLKFDLQSADEKKLAYLLAEAVGARKLVTCLSRDLEQFRLHALQATSKGKVVPFEENT